MAQRELREGVSFQDGLWIVVKDGVIVDDASTMEEANVISDCYEIEAMAAGRR